jgi:hypothetical protein
MIDYDTLIPADHRGAGFVAFEFVFEAAILSTGGA